MISWNNAYGIALNDKIQRDFLTQLLNQIRENNPLIHLITNYVTANDCANVLLASGASPIMADAPEEAAEITSASDALVINLGTLNQERTKALFLAGKCASDLGHPIILDPVGVRASSMRLKIACKLMQELKITIIRGNHSEIRMLYGEKSNAHGVDSAVQATVEETVMLAEKLAEKTESVVIVTGKTDIITNTKQTFLVKNGHSKMAQITGSGCMLSALTGAFAAVAEDYTQAAAAAVVLMGTAGELAADRAGSHLGNISFRNFLIDAISLMDDVTLVQKARIAQIMTGN